MRLTAARRRDLVAGVLALVTLGVTWRSYTRLGPGQLVSSFDWYDGTISTYLAPGNIEMVVRTTFEEPVRVLLVPAGLLLLWSALGARCPRRWALPVAAVALVVAAALAVAEARIAPTVAVLVAAALASRSAWPELGGRMRRWWRAVVGAPGGSTVPGAPG